MNQQSCLTDRDQMVIVDHFSASLRLIVIRDEIQSHPVDMIIIMNVTIVLNDIIAMNAIDALRVKNKMTTVSNLDC